ncbi:MAG: hypothetical protein GX318_01005 [Clostridia bacterium]|nr:hypothetical protein [Clostridia bacterium]
MTNFLNKFLLIGLTALGVVLGAALIGSLSVIFTREAPARTMLRLAYEIKIWAIVAALGGTFSTIEVMELGLFEGEITALLRQFIYILGAFLGAQLGYFIIYSLVGGR